MSNYIDFWRNPFANRDLNQLQKSFDRMQDEFFGPLSASKSMYFPKVEFSEDKTNYIAKFDLPGLAKDQIKVDLHENTLTVSGERREEKKEITDKKSYSEVSYGSFTRTITLPAPVNAEKVAATFENGVLSVSMEKKTASNSRQITVK